jgi:hypothetical protein
MAALPSRRTIRLALLLLLLLLAGCAVPLGPGYQLRKETVQVRLSAPSAPLRVQADITLRNAGNTPLDSLSLRLPPRLSPGEPVRILMPGRRMQALPASRNGAGQLVLPFQPPLARRHSLRFRLDYQLSQPGEDFLLEPSRWFPTAVPPRNLFAKGNAWADNTRIEISVPAGYRALTSGRLRRFRAGRPGTLTTYRYEIRHRDFAPFLLVGRYQEQKIRVGRRVVIFWTLTPLAPACAQSLATPLAATASLFRSTFGPVWKQTPPVRLIQMSPGSRFPMHDGTGRTGSLPGTVLFTLSPGEICRQTQSFVTLADRALAETWFGWAVRPGPGVGAVLGTGALDYAALLAAVSRDAGARARLVTEWLAEYDRLHAAAKPLPPVRLGDHPTGDQRRMAGIQSALCFVALEDRFGAAAVHQALAHLVHSLRGDSAGLEELRSALEQETGQNLYDWFREWFGRAEIPASFRRHYPEKQSGL